MRLRRGIGDDCAVISIAPSSDARRSDSRRSDSRNDLLVTTDLFLEGIHFRREWQPPSSVGHKVLARGLSDIAAMGGTPRYAFLSLALPKQTPAKWVDEFLRGLLELAETSGVALAGGDTSASRSGVVADIMVIGEVPRNTAVLRSGARPGDEIWVTGRLGGAALALAGLRKQGKRSSAGPTLQPLFYPQPRLRIGRALRERNLASAMIDLSDGLSIDLARLCKESGVGARVEEAAIPRSARTPLDCALHGGEDFELLFTVRSERTRLLPRRIGGVPLTRIGRIIRGRKLELMRGGKVLPLPVLGFEHF
jgi:thiamine-monophosphate kinase